MVMPVLMNPMLFDEPGSSSHCADAAASNVLWGGCVLVLQLTLQMHKRWSHTGFSRLLSISDGGIDVYLFCTIGEQCCVSVEKLDCFLFLFWQDGAWQNQECELERDNREYIT